MTAIPRTRFHWLPSPPVLIAAVWAAAVLLAPTGVWIVVGLLAQVGAYLAGRADVRRADEAAIAAQVVAATAPLAELLDRYERFVVELGEADHEAITNPPRSRADLVNPAYRSSRGTYDSPSRSGAGQPLQAGVSVD